MLNLIFVTASHKNAFVATKDTVPSSLQITLYKW